jgi:hypothetical protein
VAEKGVKLLKLNSKGLLSVGVMLRASVPGVNVTGVDLLSLFVPRALTESENDYGDRSRVTSVPSAAEYPNVTL